MAMLNNQRVMLSYTTSEDTPWIPGVFFSIDPIGRFCVNHLDGFVDTQWECGVCSAHVFMNLKEGALV
jgi:hypothetical protein